jgi:hypothetical protein
MGIRVGEETRPLREDAERDNPHVLEMDQDPNLGGVVCQVGLMSMILENANRHATHLSSSKMSCGSNGRV